MVQWYALINASSSLDSSLLWNEGVVSIGPGACAGAEMCGLSACSAARYRLATVVLRRCWGNLTCATPSPLWDDPIQEIFKNFLEVLAEEPFKNTRGSFSKMPQQNYVRGLVTEPVSEKKRQCQKRFFLLWNCFGGSRNNFW